MSRKTGRKHREGNTAFPSHNTSSYYFTCMQYTSKRIQSTEKKKAFSTNKMNYRLSQDCHGIHGIQRVALKHFQRFKHIHERHRSIGELIPGSTKQSRSNKIRSIHHHISKCPKSKRRIRIQTSNVLN